MSYTVEYHYLPAHCYGRIIGAKQGAGMHHAVSLSLQSCWNALANAGVGTYAAVHHKTVWILMPDYQAQEFATGDTQGNNNWLNTELINESIAYPYPVADDTIETYAEWTADCMAKGLIVPKKMVWGGTKGSLQSFMPHRNFPASSTACPGDYLYQRGAAIAEKINNYYNGGSSMANGVLELWKFNGKQNQMFKFTKVGDYNIIETGVPGGALDLNGNSSKAGTRVIAYKKHGKDNQLWAEIAENDEGLISLHPKLDLNMALDISGGSDNPGANAIIWPFKDTPNQKFQKKAVPGKKDWFYLQPQYSGNLWLDIAGNQLVK
jgi:hypothetical protein